MIACFRQISIHAGLPVPQVDPDTETHEGREYEREYAETGDEQQEAAPQRGRDETQGQMPSIRPGRPPHGQAESDEKDDQDY